MWYCTRWEHKGGGVALATAVLRGGGGSAVREHGFVGRAQVTGEVGLGHADNNLVGVFVLAHRGDALAVVVCGGLDDAGHAVADVDVAGGRGGAGQAGNAGHVGGVAVFFGEGNDIFSCTDGRTSHRHDDGLQKRRLSPKEQVVIEDVNEPGILLRHLFEGGAGSGGRESAGAGHGVSARSERERGFILLIYNQL